MSIYLHPKSKLWYVQVTSPSGQRIRRSTGTRDKVAAQEFHDNLCADFWRMKRLGEKQKYTFDQAALAYLEQLEGRSNYRNAEQHVRHWHQQFGGRTLCSLTTDSIEQACPTHKTLHSGKREPLAAATKNRFLATISKILNDAKKRGWIDSVPYIRKHRENNQRETFLTREQAQDFLSAIADGWMKDVCQFALATGMRAGEILSLEWAQVNLDRGLVSVLASKAKSGQGRPVPLNDDALEVIARRKNLHKQFVFARAGVRTHEVDRRVIAKAAQAAGIAPGFRFHDLRHTWASWHAQSGTPMLTLQRMGGWKTLSMLNRYAHLSADDLTAYANRSKLLPHPEKLSSERPRLRVVNS